MNEYSDVLKQQVLDSMSLIPIEYSPESWDKLSVKLDAELPVSVVKNKPNLKLRFGKNGMICLVAASVFLFTSSSSRNSVHSHRYETNDSENITPSIQQHDIDQLYVEGQEIIIDNSSSRETNQIDLDGTKKANVPQLEVPTNSKQDSLIMNNETNKGTTLTMKPPKDKKIESDTVFIFW